jgi:hypothetical protein
LRESGYAPLEMVVAGECAPLIGEVVPAVGEVLTSMFDVGGAALQLW